MLPCNAKYACLPCLLFASCFVHIFPSNLVLSLLFAKYKHQITRHFIIFVANLKSLTRRVKNEDKLLRKGEIHNLWLVLDKSLQIFARFVAGNEPRRRRPASNR